MGVFKVAWKALQIVGAALDIRDISSLIRRALEAAGAAALLVAAANWIDKNVPQLTLVLTGVGFFLLFLVVLPDLWKWVPRKAEPMPTTPLDSPDATDSMAVFDPYSIITELGGVDLTGLSQPDSFMMITMNVRNASGYPVTITGVKGRIRCANAECNIPATVELEPRHLRTSAYDRVPCTIRQPLSSEMMNTITLQGNLLRISLSGLQWVGSVALPQGSVSLESCYMREDFVVKGPFRDKRDAGALFRLKTTFVSSEHYDSDGAPKRDD